MISARVHYAAIAMLELALHRDSEAPVAIREITDRHGIPGPFLVQILRSLRTAGWVQSVRGSQGGYRLSVDPSQLTLLELADVIGCPESGVRSGSNSRLEKILVEQWDEAAAASRNVLAETRLSDLVDRCRHGDASMFYI